MGTHGWTKGPNPVAALVAVAVLLAHALVMGWHVPPSLRVLAALDGGLQGAFASGICHADPAGHDAPDTPSSPSDHLAHCPTCLSVDGGKLLGPVTGPAVPPPDRTGVAAAWPAAAPSHLAGTAAGFSARAPPAAV
ncbi:hypothetical protein SAMN02982994_4163 [Azospirillum lipoferum]|nr:hypothetical protein SAMN02982994_4163 [Azospirillum lipoferum]